jgi:thioredoxin-related protein
MQKVLILPVILFSAVVISAFRPGKEKEKLNWITIEEAEAKYKAEARPILVDLYTDWCGWCKVMDKKTYSNQQLIKYLNEKYYVVKFNAERRDAITWKGKKYEFNSAYKTHQLAIELTSGQLSYPTTIFMPDINDTPQTIAGMLEIKEMELITKYFGEKKYGSVAFDDYAKKFKSAWK